MKNRGVSKDDIRYWKIGYCNDGEYGNRIIIPSFNEKGYINYFVARTFTNGWPKYKNPTAKRDLVFNELCIDWDRPIVLVEGVFDAIKAGPNSVPMLGSSLREQSKLFNTIVERSSKIYLALDADAIKKELWIAKRLMEYGIELYKVDIDGYTDVGEMDKQTFIEKKAEAKPINCESSLLYQTLAV